MTRTVTIPTLITDRLTLRLPAAGDFEAYAAYMASQRPGQITPRSNRFDAWLSFAAELGHWALHGYGMFAVQEKSSGKTAGMVGFFDPEGWPEPELGWTLFEGFEGGGYAHEAAICARDWAYGDLGWKSVISITVADNARSIRLMERLGATLESNWTYPSGQDALIYRHPGPGAAP